MTNVLILNSKMKNFIIALSLCACTLNVYAVRIKHLPVGEKVVDIKITDDWRKGQSVFVMTRTMRKDDIAECYKFYEIGNKFYTLEKICEQKQTEKNNTQKTDKKKVSLTK